MEDNMTEFTQRIIEAIRKIPYGNVASYGLIATMAGNPSGARQVARTLHTLTNTKKLQWHRIVNSKGEISMNKGRGYEEQRAFLESEGIIFDLKDRIPKNYFYKG